MNQTVSILIPCYNAERWIAQAIQSALDQTYPNKEVIVMNDGSSDRSLEIIKSFSNQICWESQPNRGGNATRNRLLELSTGEWLQYLDADDYLLPEKIEKQINLLSQNPKTDVICSPAISEYHDEEKIWTEPSPQLHPRDPWILLARWRLPQTGGSLWRKQAIVDAGGWKVDQPCCQEHELYLRLLMAGKQLNFYDHSGAVYRLWSHSTVSRKNKYEPLYRRLEVKDRLEQYLETIGELNQARQDAISQSRFECARIIYGFNKELASSIVARIHQRNLHFQPKGTAAPMLYYLIYRFFGFKVAERIAAIKRNLTLKRQFYTC